MATVDASCTLAGLSRLATDKLSHESGLYKLISEASHVFPQVLPFTTPTELEAFYKTEHFDSLSDFETCYGVLRRCAASKALQDVYLRRNLSLQHLCILRLISLPSSVVNIDILMNLPVKIYRSFIICNFVVLWLPLTHALFHKDNDCRRSFDVVFAFLSNLKIFDRMYNSCKEIQLFIHSFLQHSHTYSVCNNGAISVTPVPNSEDLSPLIPPHELSHRLVANLEANLSSVFKNGSCGSAESILLIEAAVAVGLKVGKFLNESSEYANSYSAAHLVYNYVRTHARACSVPNILSIRWEYEAMCIMLRSMNSHNMYLEQEHRLVFCQEAPRLLRHILQLGINANRSSPRKSEISEELLLSSLPPELLQPRRTALHRNLLLYCGSGARILDTTLSEPTENPFSSSSASSSSSIFEELFPLGLGESRLNASTSNDYSLESLFSNETPAEFPPPEDAEVSEEGDSTVTNCPITEATSSPDAAAAPLSTAYLHAQLAIFYYAMCNYRLAYQFTILAMDEIGGLASIDDPSTASPHLHPSVVVEVLRIACRVCIIQRKYALGMRIIRRAISYARKHLGRQNVTYANLLLEYGCLLLNMDKTHRAASIYRLGLAIILDCLPGASIMAALALEDIAYAYYVLEYSSGNFAYAIECADVAGTLLKRLQYEVCMQAASANRVKALILEEIALDDNDPSRTKSYLYTARDLHLQSLDLCERTFGTWNIQTAKHFGNLGRLFQSLEHNKAAEEMHLKAIMIKERLLGANDFEVGLSVGHLASLYNYHMNRYHEAELLYLRSIKISLNLFGPTYSGLEYDYRGLQRVYRKLGETAKLQHYQSLFDEWLMQRQSLRFLEPTDNEPIEPTFRSTTTTTPAEGQPQAVAIAEQEEDEEDEESALTQLLEDYRLEFSSTLGQTASAASSKAESTSNPAVASPGRSISPAPGGENSRSTGY